jgi:hypothetical protein
MLVCLHHINFVRSHINIPKTLNRSLRRADRTFKGVLPTVVRHCLCDLETSWMRRPWPNGDCCAKNKTKPLINYQANLIVVFLKEICSKRSGLASRDVLWTLTGDIELTPSRQTYGIQTHILYGYWWRHTLVIMRHVLHIFVYVWYGCYVCVQAGVLAVHLVCFGLFIHNYYWSLRGYNLKWPTICPDWQTLNMTSLRLRRPVN